MSWQPIETVPRGEEVLVCVTYNLPPDESGDVWVTDTWVDTFDQEWFRWADRIDIPFKPTHWMPLPAPPPEDTPNAD